MNKKCLAFMPGLILVLLIRIETQADMTEVLVVTILDKMAKIMADLL
jgi:hypothetical protein